MRRLNWAFTCQTIWAGASVAQSDSRPAGDQKVAGLVLAGSGNILS